MKKISTLILVTLFSVAVFAAEKKAAVVGKEQTVSSKSGKSYNITVDPIFVLIGMISGTFEYKWNDNWTVGPDFLFWNMSLGSWRWSATGLGARATWYANGTYADGWYVSPSFDFLSLSASYSSGSTTGSASASATTLGVGGGYAWFWDSFNMNLGLAAATGLGSSSMTITDSTGARQTSSIPTGAGLSFRMGFAF